MKIIILGAAGFIGTNLVLELIKNTTDKITAVDETKAYFSHYPQEVLDKIEIVELPFDERTDFHECIAGQDIVYHLISTNNPSTSNKNIGKELTDNILISIHLLEACIKNYVKKVIFLSSGGTVYGKEALCPIAETSQMQPINTYGIQKFTIEKLLYLYEHLYGLNYCIVRLSNPYGPYQRPNGQLGVISTFIYNALHNKKIFVYGDGTVIRDYLYISDAVNAILNLTKANTNHHIYNIGSGKGTSINTILDIMKKELAMRTKVEYVSARDVDVPVNYLDISRYKREFGQIETIPFIDGMKKTLLFLENWGA